MVVVKMDEFCAARDRGEIVEISQELFEYFLGVLPPVWMDRFVTMPDGRQQKTAFGFAEGWEMVTVFWRKRDVNGAMRHYAQKTNIRNPDRW